jgi:hypothetical protein
MVDVLDALGYEPLERGQPRWLPGPTPGSGLSQPGRADGNERAELPPG